MMILVGHPAPHKSCSFELDSSVSGITKLDYSKRGAVSMISVQVFLTSGCLTAEFRYCLATQRFIKVISSRLNSMQQNFGTGGQLFLALDFSCAATGMVIELFSVCCGTVYPETSQLIAALIRSFQMVKPRSPGLIKRNKFSSPR